MLDCTASAQAAALDFRPVDLALDQTAVVQQTVADVAPAAWCRCTPDCTAAPLQRQVVKPAFVERQAQQAAADHVDWFRVQPSKRTARKSHPSNVTRSKWQSMKNSRSASALSARDRGSAAFEGSRQGRRLRHRLSDLQLNHLGVRQGLLNHAAFSFHAHSPLNNSARHPARALQQTPAETGAGVLPVIARFAAARLHCSNPASRKSAL